MKRRIGRNRAGTNSEDRSQYADIGCLILRIGSSAFMLFGHGADKLVNFADTVTQFPDPLGFGATASLVLAVFAEFFCSLALMFGFLTRLATIPLLITMLVAAFVVHGSDPWASQERALLFFLAYLTILIAGPGRFSIDRVIFHKSNGL